MGARVRGIYSTAISKILTDNGISLFDPSSKQRERFEEEDKEFCDVSISDLSFPIGIKIRGAEIEKILEWIKKCTGEPIIYKDFIGRIYPGKEIGRIGDSFIIETELGLGICEKKPIPDKPFQIKEIKQDGTIVYTQHLRLFGKYVVLIEGGYNSFSREIPNGYREKTRKLCNEMKIDNFGIFFLPFSINREKSEIKEDIDYLLSIYEEIKRNKEKFISPFLPTIVLFKKEEREKLDKIRSEILNTFPKHHLLRIFGMADELDILEKYCTNSDAAFKEIENKLTSQIVQINHYKVLGGNVVLKRKLLERKNEKFICFKVVSSEGFYDGLFISKKPGDYIITEIEEGSYFVKHKYFRKNSREIGEYYSLNTPIERVGTNFVYIDLELDIVKMGDTGKEIDKDRYKMLINEGIISNNLEREIEENIKRILGK